MEILYKYLYKKEKPSITKKLLRDRGIIYKLRDSWLHFKKFIKSLMEHEILT